MDEGVFGDLHRAMRAQVDQELLPCVATALLRGREVVDRFHHGWADREARVAVREGVQGPWRRRPLVQPYLALTSDLPAAYPRSTCTRESP
jgi:hypothetical protein